MNGIINRLCKTVVFVLLIAMGTAYALPAFAEDPSVSPWKDVVFPVMAEVSGCIRLNVRSAPHKNDDSVILAWPSAGTKVLVTGKGENNYLQVKLEDGTVGYSYAGYLTRTSGTTSSSSFSDFSKYVPTNAFPYLPSGNIPKNFDYLSYLFRLLNSDKSEEEKDYIRSVLYQIMNGGYTIPSK